MSRISVSDGALTVDVQGLHQLWALTRRIRVPLSHVRGATADPGIVEEPKGLRSPGLHMPGSAVVGTFTRDGETHFWDLRSGSRAVVIELTGEPYDRLIIDVEDPRSTVDMINGAVHDFTSSNSPDVEFSESPHRPPLSSPQWKIALLGAIVIDGVLKVAMLVDVSRRPRRSLRGSKRTWRALALVNFFGPLAYFTIGRRSPSPTRRGKRRHQRSGRTIKR